MSDSKFTVCELNCEEQICEDNWPCDVWRQAHVVPALQALRKELSIQAPSVALNSNVEIKVASMKTKLTDASTLRFRDELRSEQGTMRPFKKPHVVLDSHYEPDKSCDCNFHNRSALAIYLSRYIVPG